MKASTHNYQQQMISLRKFVEDEHEAGLKHFMEIWGKSLQGKIDAGETQVIKSVRREDSHSVIVALGDNQSRFREGDMIRLYKSEPLAEACLAQGTIEAENDDEWLIRFSKIDREVLSQLAEGCYADPCTMDLKDFYMQSLNDIAMSKTGREVVLPLLFGELNINAVDEALYDKVAEIAEAAGFNEDQQQAVALGVASKYLVCIQGPPGTGKTRVIGEIAKLLVARNERVFLTSHTHMAINNALNATAKHDVPVAKIGSVNSTKGLSKDIICYSKGDDWQERPDSGYVIGATPFATCSSRLEAYEFDTIIFDEASQITLPLAIMAMRKGKRFVFVGDHKQLPPVLLSDSVFSSDSAFSRLLTNNDDVSVMLQTTYRLSKALSSWPSAEYYQGRLLSEGSNKNRNIKFLHAPKTHAKILEPNNPFVFIPSPSNNSKSQNAEEAELVVNIVCSAVNAGLDVTEIGIVAPFRQHGKNIRKLLRERLGYSDAGKIVADTVERMQGQEREMVIVSLCATQPAYLKAISEFIFMPERLNVSITRSKTKLIVIGPEIESDFISGYEISKSLRESIAAYKSLIQSARKIELENI